jgi:hypothetical protein
MKPLYEIIADILSSFYYLRITRIKLNQEPIKRLCSLDDETTKRMLKVVGRENITIQIYAALSYDI